MSVDSRLECVVGDHKAGTAAHADARSKLTELWGENPALAPEDAILLEKLLADYDRLVDRADAMLGTLVRLQDRAGGAA